MDCCSSPLTRAIPQMLARVGAFCQSLGVDERQTLPAGLLAQLERSARPRGRGARRIRGHLHVLGEPKWR